MQRRPMPAAVTALALVVALLCGRPAAAQSPSPDVMAAARELVVAAHIADQFKTLLPLVMQQLKPAIVQGRADVERDYDALMPQLAESAAARSQAFADEVAGIYARHFTVDELQQIIAFYRGPAGQKYLQQMPAISQESLAMGQRLGQEIATELRNRMLEELRKRGHDL